jgi:glycosyltransferase involved in cell wall biosynthesis
MAESLAVGTPVVAFASGAAPEIVDDGLTGFLRDDELGAALAVRELAGIDRTDCRASAEQRFSITRMALDYQTLFASLRNGWCFPGPRARSGERPHSGVANSSRVKVEL